MKVCPKCCGLRVDRVGRSCPYCTYSPTCRAAEKQASRDEDARRLACGEVTPAELRRENSFIPEGTKIVILDHGGPPRRGRR